MVRFQTFLMCQFCKTHCQNKKLKQIGHTLLVVLPISASSMHSSWIHLLQQHSSHSCSVPISLSGLYWCFHPCNVWLSFILSKLHAGSSRLSLKSYSLLCLPLLLLCFLGLCYFFFSCFVSLLIHQLCELSPLPCVSVLYSASFWTFSPAFTFPFPLVLVATVLPSLSRYTNINNCLEHKLFLSLESSEYLLMTVS